MEGGYSQGATPSNTLIANIIEIIKLFILLYPLTLFLVSKCHPMRLFISY